MNQDSKGANKKTTISDQIKSSTLAASLSPVLNYKPKPEIESSSNLETKSGKPIIPKEEDLPEHLKDFNFFLTKDIDDVMRTSVYQHDGDFIWSLYQLELTKLPYPWQIIIAIRQELIRFSFIHSKFKNAIEVSLNLLTIIDSFEEKFEEEDEEEHRIYLLAVTYANLADCYYCIKNFFKAERYYSSAIYHFTIDENRDNKKLISFFSDRIKTCKEKIAKTLPQHIAVIFDAKVTTDQELVFLEGGDLFESHINAYNENQQQPRLEKRILEHIKQSPNLTGSQYNQLKEPHNHHIIHGIYERTHTTAVKIITEQEYQDTTDFDNQVVNGYGKLYCANKIAFAQLCKKEGIPHPRTLVIPLSPSQEEKNLFPADFFPTDFGKDGIIIKDPAGAEGKGGLVVSNLAPGRQRD